MAACGAEPCGSRGPRARLRLKSITGTSLASRTSSSEKSRLSAGTCTVVVDLAGLAPRRRDPAAASGPGSSKRHLVPGVVDRFDFEQVLKLPADGLAVVDAHAVGAGVARRAVDRHAQQPGRPTLDVDQLAAHRRDRALERASPAHRSVNRCCPDRRHRPCRSFRNHSFEKAARAKKMGWMNPPTLRAPQRRWDSSLQIACRQLAILVASDTPCAATRAPRLRRPKAAPVLVRAGERDPPRRQSGERGVPCRTRAIRGASDDAYGASQAFAKMYSARI